MIDLDSLITASQLSKELGIAQQTASTILRQVGGGKKIGNVTLYDRGQVRRAVMAKNFRLLDFLGMSVHEEEDGAAPVDRESDTVSG